MNQPEDALRAVLDARDRLHAAQSQLDQAQRSTDMAAANLNARLEQYAHELATAGQPAPAKLVESLYWDEPRVYVKILAQVVGGTSAAGLHEHIPGATRDCPCHLCGKQISVRIRSRNRAKSSQDLLVDCSSCAPTCRIWHPNTEAAT